MAGHRCSNGVGDVLNSAVRGLIAASVAVGLAVGMWGIADAGASSADPPGCVFDTALKISVCDVSVGSTTSSSAPSSSSTASGISEVPKCYFYSIEVSCTGPDGWPWNVDAKCWVGPADPEAGIPRTKVTGEYHKAYCPDPTWTEANPKGWYIDVYIPDPVPSQPSPIVLAEEAAATIALRPPNIGIDPTHDGSGLVGLPVWMWTVQSPETWGTHKSVPQTQGGLSVTATATAKSIAWDMGDGHTVTCENPGTAYDPSDGLSASPNCGYTYTQPSGGKPGGVYTVTATTTWQVSWTASDGQAGTLPDQLLSSSTTVKIGELQAVN